LSWLNNIERVFTYACPKGSIYEVIGTQYTDEATEPCPCCGVKGTYQGFKNKDSILLAQAVRKETFDQNGRKGVKITDRNGKTTYMSQTKYDYIETGDTNSKITPGFQEALNNQDDKQERYLKAETNKRRGRVSTAKFFPAKGDS
jgi:hypothetical protein